MTALSFPVIKEEGESLKAKTSNSFSTSVDGLGATSPPPVYSKARDIKVPEEGPKISYTSTLTTLRDSQSDPLEDLIVKDLDIGFKFFCERLKVNLTSCKEVIQFIKRNTQIFEDMSVQLGKFSGYMHDHAAQENMGLVKPGSFLESWKGILLLSQEIGQSNSEILKEFQTFSHALVDLHKHTERSRKNCKDNSLKIRRSIDEAVVAVDKTRQRLDYLKEEISKSNSAAANGTSYKNSLFKSSKSPEKYMDELVAKQNVVIRLFQEQSLSLESLKDSYFTVHLPAMIKTMKELDCELSAGITKYLGLFLMTWRELLIKGACKIDPSAIKPLREGPLSMKVDTPSAMNYLGNIKDSEDVLSQYKEFYKVSLAEVFSVEEKCAGKSKKPSVSHRKYSDDSSKANK